MSLSGSHKDRKYPKCLSFAACFLATLPLFGQTAPRSGQVSGKVAGPSGSGVAAARVVLYSSSSSADQKRTETDTAGHYSFSGLSPGAYKVSATAAGFRDSEIKIIFLTSATATADLTLTPLAPGSDAAKPGRASRDFSPEFSAAGMRGTIAPSGYASGLSSQETAHVRASANALQPMFFSTLLGGTRIDCSQESVLLSQLEKAPQDFRTNHALGDFYLGHGDYLKAIHYLEAARSLAPADFNSSRDLATAMIGDGRGNDAAGILQQLLRDRAPDATSLKLLAFAYRSTAEYEKSIAAFLKAAAIDQDAENQYDCGVGLIQIGALKEALDLFAGATTAHRESARLWLGLGIAQYLLFHHPEAVSALLHSADADPHFLAPLAILAELASLSDETQADLRRRIANYLRAHPGDAEAHFVCALVASKQAHPEEVGASRQDAALHLKRAIELNPRMARAHFLLGVMETEANNLPGAIDAFVEVLKLEPGNARAHYRLALLYRRKGQQEDASREMNAYRMLHGKEGDEDGVDGMSTVPASVLSLQTVSAQRGCGAKQE